MNDKLMASVWLVYKKHYGERNEKRRWKGQPQARVLLAFGVPASELMPEDRDRGLKPMDLANARHRAHHEGWLWPEIYQALKEQADGPPDIPDTADSVARNTDAPSMDAPQRNDGKRDRGAGPQDGVEAPQREPVKAEGPARAWLVVEYPNRDAVELGEPRYWIFWYDPQHDGGFPRCRLWNWKEERWDHAYQTPWSIYPEHISGGEHVWISFGDAPEENFRLHTQDALLLEEWEDIMGRLPVGETFMAAQDPNNMPIPNIPVNRSWGRSGRGGDKEMYVDEYGYLWDRKSDFEIGEPPLGHVVDGAWPPLQERLRPLFPTAPDNHPSRGR